MTGARPPAATILVVDDNAAKRLAVRAMLAPLGHDVVEADSGRAALRAVHAPGLRGDPDGRAHADDGRLRDREADPPAQPVRAHADHLLHRLRAATRPRRTTAYASGAVDFIFTPIRVDILRAKVSAFVELYMQAQELQRSLESITSLNAALRESEVRAQGGDPERGRRDRDGRRGRAGSSRSTARRDGCSATARRRWSGSRCG